MDRPQKVRLKPRISAAKFGDYLDAKSATAREKILYDQKFPRTPVVARYREAEDAIRAALLSAGDTAELLNKAVEGLSGQPAKSEWHADARSLCGRAMHLFSKVAPSIESGKVTFAPPPSGGYLLRVRGVTISVFPLVRISRRSKDGIGRGLLLAVMRKDDPVTDRAGRAVAELLRIALDSSGETSVDPRLCLVVDVFRGVIHRPSKGGKRTQDEIVSTCREIAAIWDSIRLRGAA